jgi:hypothetical protein
MNLKFLNALAFLAIVATSCACATEPSNHLTIWSGSPVGKCYVSLDQYLESTYSERYHDDENIRVSKLKGGDGKKSYYWVWDNTPEVNVTSTLFEVAPSGRACGLLYVPLSNLVSLKLDRAGNLPNELSSTDSPPAGYPTTRITYRRNRDGTYRTALCESVNARARRVIDCSRVFSGD